MKREYSTPHIWAIPSSPGLIAASDKKGFEAGNGKDPIGGSIDETDEDDVMGAKKHGGPFSEYMWE